jgi:hypothetical protein
MPTPEQCFALALEAFAGRRFELGSGSGKMLRILLGGHDLDASITPSGIRLSFGGRTHDYMPETAPAIVSWLLDAAGAQPDTREITASIGPAEMRTYGIWRLSRLHVRLSATRELIAIRVRSAAEALDVPLPLPRPLPEPPYVVLPERCPHCGEVPERYRVLHDWSLVCLACGRSQPARDQPSNG